MGGSIALALFAQGLGKSGAQRYVGPRQQLHQPDRAECQGELRRLITGSASKQAREISPVRGPVIKR